MPPLLHTKLYAPAVRADLVARQRLCERLNAGLWTRPTTGRVEFARKLTLVAAPAGFGKTTLVAKWLADFGWPILDFGTATPVETTPKSKIQNPKLCWLSLDEGDNDPARFIAYFIAAVQGAAPNLGGEAQVALPRANVAALDGILTLLLNDIAAAPQPLLLTLDDCHVLHNETVIH